MNRRTAAWSSSLLAACLLWMLATPASGQDADTASLDATVLDAEVLDATAAEIASQLRCPVCRNQSVLESSSELAREMQRLIREKLAAGESPEGVTEFFVSKYGEWVLLKPEPSGINLLVYILPLAVVVLAAGVLQGRIRSWVRAGTASRVAAFTVAPEGSPVTDAISVVENEQSDMPNVVSARTSAENERWLEQALEE